MWSRTILAGLASALCAFVLFGTGLTPHAPARGLVAPKSKCGDASGFRKKAAARRSMVCLTNFARRRKGLKRYRVNPKLTRSAGRKASDILRCDDFSHTACGRPFLFWFDRYGYTKRPGWSAGENIAWGSGSFGNSRSIFRAWLKSPSHRRAILEKDYAEIGIGIRKGRLTGVRGARVWVQHFGRRG